MASIEGNQRFWSDYDWSRGGEEWSASWGGSPWLWWGTIYPRVHRWLPARTAVEIGPGFGRFTRFLKNFAERLLLFDVTTRCLDACRAALGSESHLSFFLNDGRSLTMAPTGDVDFVFSFDSLVHADADVIEAYLAEAARILSPDGVAFIHHSNLAALIGPAGLTFSNDHGRSENVSAERFAAAARACGLSCPTQELVNWGGGPLIDCFSVVTRPGSRHDHPPRRRENQQFMAEAASVARVSSLYGP
jgi:SAM-dependent methyltransferase